MKKCFIHCIFLAGILSSLSFSSEASLPFYFQAHYDDARDVIASKPYLWSGKDLAWQPKIEPRGKTTGETKVTVSFAEPFRAIPIRFGIPLGQVPSPDKVVIYDDKGKVLPADVFALVNFESCPLHWVMITTVLDASGGGNQELTIQWGPDVSRPEPESPMHATLEGDRVEVTGGGIEFGLSVKDLLHDIHLKDGKHTFALNGSEVSFIHEGKTYCHQPEGQIQMLFDGPLYKRLRVVSSLMDPKFKLHFEVEVWANSPYMRVYSRLINEQRAKRNRDAVSWFDLSDLNILKFRPSRSGYQISAGDHKKEYTGQQEVALIQQSDTWMLQTDGNEKSRDDGKKIINWTRMASDGDALMLIAPHFQGYSAPDPDLESLLTVKSDGAMGLTHYRSFPEPGVGTVKFWETAARTFPMVLYVSDVFRSPEYWAGGAAVATKQWPTVTLDRKFLTSQGVFHESLVSAVYDEASLEGSRYFDRTRVDRRDYPRAGRGMPPHFEGWNEGLEHPNPDTGGMLFGEVWQYTSAFPSLEQIEKFLASARGPNGNLPSWYKPYDVNGILTYRCGDHCLGMAYSYLRTGDRQVFEILQDHSLLYADWAIAHPRGWCHYYTAWDEAGRVYTRLSGPLLSYLVLGDPWLFEVGEQMGGFLVSDWDEENRPNGGQTRFVYPARGLCLLYEITGHRSYWNTAVDDAIWTLQSSLHAQGQVYAFHFPPEKKTRISELFAGYVMGGMCPVYERCGNEKLFTAIQRTGDWLITRQSIPQCAENIGGWCRDQMIQGQPNIGPGNYGAMTLCAALQTWLAQRTEKQKYFYSAAAAWANLVTSTHHKGIKGGLPMQMGDSEKIGTWSDKFPIYLHQLPSTAKRFGWPFVIEGVFNGEPGRKSPIVVFVDKGGSFDNGVFRQPLYAVNEEPVSISIWCPGPPCSASFETVDLDISYNSEESIAKIILPPYCESGVLAVVFK